MSQTGMGCSLACSDDRAQSSFEVDNASCVASRDDEGWGQVFRCRARNEVVFSGVFGDAVGKKSPRVTKVVQDSEGGYDSQNASSGSDVNGGGQEYVKARNGRGIFAIVR